MSKFEIAAAAAITAIATQNGVQHAIAHLSATQAVYGGDPAVLKGLIDIALFTAGYKLT